MKFLFGFISIMFFFVNGSPVKWAPHSKNVIASLETLNLVRPVLKLEEFPSGKPLQSSLEEALSVSDIKECLSDHLRNRIQFGESGEISYQLSAEMKTEIGEMFERLRTTSDIANVILPDAVAETLGENQYYLFVYYEGYSRSRESMRQGYQSSAFQTESVPRAYARDIGDFDSNKRGVFKALPKRYGATLMIAVVRGDGGVLYYATAQSNDNPSQGATVRKLIANCTKAMRNIKKTDNLSTSGES